MTESSGSKMSDRQRARRFELVREEVIDAALAEFAERGFHQTSISHIAKRLGSGHSMFYRYFENKCDIVEHAVRKVNARLSAATSGVWPGQIRSIDEFLRYTTAITMAYVQLLAEDPRLMQLVLVQATATDQQMSDEFNHMFDGAVHSLSTMLSDGIGAGYIRPDIDVIATAGTIVAIPFGMALRHRQKPDYEVLVAHTRATTDLVSRGIAAEWLAPNVVEHAR